MLGFGELRTVKNRKKFGKEEKETLKERVGGGCILITQLISNYYGHIKNNSGPGGCEHGQKHHLHVLTNANAIFKV